MKTKLKSNYHKMTKEDLINELEEMRQRMTKLTEIEAECRLLFKKSHNQAMELKSLNTELINRNDELKIINAITHATHESFDLEEVYNVSLNMIVELVNVDIAMIYLIDIISNEAVLQSYRNLSEDYIIKAGRIPYGKGVTWRVINLGQVVNIEDIQKDENIGQAGKDLGHHSALGIPIILEKVVKVVMGVIWFCSYKKRKLNNEEIALLTSVIEGQCLQNTLVKIPLKTINRHGLIAGATGTGKTKTIQVLAEGLSEKSIPVLLMDLKGDLSGLQSQVVVIQKKMSDTTK